MYKILTGKEELLNRGCFPDWVNLSAFCVTHRYTDAVEVHYHNYEEVWFWWKGHAECWVENVKFSLRPGILLYTPPHRQHAFKETGERSNTLIVPRIIAGQEWGHRHLEETGETLEPARDSILLLPEETVPEADYAFPEGTFMRRACGGAFASGTAVLSGKLDAWAAILVRKGALTGTADGEDVTLEPGQCLCLAEGTSVQLQAPCASDLALVMGWPQAYKKNTVSEQVST